MSDLHKIVIIGGGAGGLELVTQLGDIFGKQQKASITLVDQNLTHIWKPLLHEIAAGTINPHEEETNYFAHAAQHHYQFVLGRFISVQRQEKTIRIESKSLHKNGSHHPQLQLSYDTLIIAIGSHCNDFNTPGVKQHCHFLDSPAQAHIFQQDLLHLYLDAQHLHEQRALNIALIGAGPTGVELAAELVHVKQNFVRYGLNKVDPNQVTVSLIEASSRILPALSIKTSDNTQHQLQQLGVEVLTEHRVTAVDAEKVYFSDGTSLNAEVKVWAAGIKAPDVLTQLDGLETDHLQRLKVFATLQTLQDPNIFAFGDCAHCQPIADEPALAPRAQVASQQAHFLVAAMKARLKDLSQPMFRFSEKGSLVSLSQKRAVGEILGQINVQGILAKSMYLSLYRMHQATIHGYTHAGLLTAKDLVSKKMGPKIKLH